MHRAARGAPGIGQGKPGDLYLEIEFRPHARDCGRWAASDGCVRGGW